MTYQHHETMRGTTRAFCVVWGDPTSGLKVMGPCTDPEFVAIWAKRNGLEEGQYWLSYLYHPMD